MGEAHGLSDGVIKALAVLKQDLDEAPEDASVVASLALTFEVVTTILGLDAEDILKTARAALMSRDKGRR